MPRRSKRSISVSVRLSCSVIVCALGGNDTFAATVNVPAGNVSALKSAVAAANPGDIIILDGGSYATGITTSVSGTATAPITIEGINGATLTNITGTGEGIEVNNNYYVFQNIAITGFQESFRTDAANYCVANGITASNSKIEAFKFKNTSTHWLVENCTVNNSGMEGFYCGDASQNWTGGVPDATSFITFYHDINNVNVNDGFDCKEGTSNVRIIDCESNWNNTVPGANDEGDSGAYVRNDNEEIVNYTILNNGSVGNVARVETATVNGITYGSNSINYGLVANNIAGSILNTTQSNTVLYTNYSMTNVAGGLLESGSKTPSEPAPSTFTETTWTSAGGIFNEGSFLPVNMIWNNSTSAVGDGATWDYNQQNFMDPGSSITGVFTSNGSIPVIFFQGVNVTFNDANNGHYAVTIGAAVDPTVVTVNNSSGNYVFSGSGSITGAATLTKSGSGSLTLATANSYTGSTTISAGTLIVTNSASLGAITGGSVNIGSGGTLDLSGNTTSNQLNFGLKLFNIAGTGSGGTGAIVNNSAETQEDALQNVALTADATIGGSQRFDIRSSSTSSLNATLNLAGHTLTKSGTNQISLVGTNITNGGSIIVSNGTLSLETVTTTAGTGSITYNTKTNAQFFKNTIIDGGVTWPLIFDGSNLIGNASSTVATIPAPITLSGNVIFTPLNGGIADPSSNNPLTMTGNISQSGGSFSMTKSGVNTLTLSGANNWTGGTNIQQGTLIMGSSAALPIGGAVTFGDTSNDSSTLDLNGNSPTIGGLTVTGSGTATIANSSTTTRSVLTTSSLTIAGQLDLTTNDLIVHNGNLSQIVDQITQGRNGSTIWTGNGITSSSAANPTSTALGVELNNGGKGNVLTSTFDGQPVTNTDVLVKYTFVGDADLSGKIDAIDYALIDNGFNNHLTGWRNGDFNYDGVVNGDDYTLIDNAFNTQGTVSFAAIPVVPTQMISSSTSQVSAVPEPNEIALLIPIYAGFMKRKRRI
jgi:autotransporter-associated beta strand protein